MDQILKTFDISEKLIKLGVILPGFIPDNFDNIIALQKIIQDDFDKYLEKTLLELKSNAIINFSTLTPVQKDILVIEIGGTKTTVQQVRAKKNIELTFENIGETITLSTLSSEELISKDVFYSWLVDLISGNKKDVKNISINLPTAISDEGVILRQAPNLKIENIIGDNIHEILLKAFPDCSFTIQNDTQACLAIELTKETNANIYADINGTGSNCAVYTSTQNLQNLEYGRVFLEDFQTHLENFTGGKIGIEKTFNDLYQAYSKTEKIYNTYEIYNLFKEDIDDELHDLAKVIFHRFFIFKAISFICIDTFCKRNKIVSNSDSVFHLFGGINKLDDTKQEINIYLKILKSEIKLENALYEVLNGVYGAAAINLLKI